MSALGFVVASDYLPEQFGSWYLLNACLQKQSGSAVCLHMPASASEEAELVASGKAGLIYANPFDAAHLIRERGYLPLVRGRGKYDEVVLAVAADSPYNKVEDLPENIRVCIPPDKNVRNIGLRLLEAANLDETNIRIEKTDAFAKVTSALWKGRADVGFFLADVYHSLSEIARSRLRILIESRISDLYHVILLHRDHAALQDTFRNAFCGMHRQCVGQRVLNGLNLPQGFEPLEHEDAEFLADLTETLLD